MKDLPNALLTSSCFCVIKLTLKSVYKLRYYIKSNNNNDDDGDNAGKEKFAKWQVLTSGNLKIISFFLEK